MIGLDGDFGNNFPGTAGITVLGGTPTLVNNTIEGGDAQGGFWPGGACPGHRRDCTLE